MRGTTLHMPQETQRALTSEVTRVLNLLNDGKTISAFKLLEDLRTALTTNVPPYTLDSAVVRERHRIQCLKQNIQTLVEAL